MNILTRATALCVRFPKAEPDTLGTAAELIKHHRGRAREGRYAEAELRSRLTLRRRRSGGGANFLFTNCGLGLVMVWWLRRCYGDRFALQPPRSIWQRVVTSRGVGE
jgi:hypothetical protein